MSNGTGLGKPITLNNLTANSFAGSQGEFGTQRSRSREDRLEAGKVIVVHQRVLGERQHDRRHEIGLCHRMVLDYSQKLLEIEAGHGDRGRPGIEHGVHQHLHAIYVKEGKDRHGNLALLHPQGRFSLDEVGYEVAMGEHHSFGQPGGTTRIRKHHHILPGVDCGVTR